MRSFLPRIFRSKEKAATSVDDAPGVVRQVEEVKQKKAWTLKILKKYRFRGAAAKREAKLKPGMVKVSSMRRPRRPNMATTQRKIAASQKRLRNLQQVADAKEQYQEASIARSRTYPSIDKLHTTPQKQERSLAESGDGCVRRTKTGSAFLMNNEQGCASIEVEFTDEGEDLSTGCRKGTRFPLPFKASPRAAAKNSKVTWKQKSKGEATPTLRTAPSGCSSSGTSLRDDSKATEGTEWESVAEHSEEAVAAWRDFHREQMLMKLAGMKMQKAPASQDFTAKRALRLTPSANPKKKSRIPRSKRNASCVSSVTSASEIDRKLSCC